MKPRPPSRIGRKRRALGWTHLTLGLLVAGVWVWSGWQRPYVLLNPWSLDVENGVVCVAWSTSRNEGAPASGVQLARLYERGWEWWLHKPFLTFSLGQLDEFYNDRYWNAGIVSHITRSPKAQPAFLREWKFILWPIPLLLWTPAALLLRSSGILARRRVMTGQCSKCGYSLAGLGDGAACPECGKAPMQKTVS